MKIGSLLLRLTLVLALLVAPVQATWSIIVVDLHTREVAVGTATCVTNTAILKAVPVVRVGTGAGAAQGVPAMSTRKRIWVGLINGAQPRKIIGGIKANDSVAAIDKQFGIVDLVPDHPPLTFSGAQTLTASFGIARESGSLRYAIQGNVIVSDALVEVCEAALLNTPGDLSQKLMAAMEAARAFGGDGRCSCLTGPPASCGAPPPNFVKSAHTAGVVVARIGDLDGTCTSAGCVTGNYYLKLGYNGNLMDPDPVLELQRQYDAWRAGLIGRPDQLKSQVDQPAPLIADGSSQSTVQIRLVDVDGNPLAAGGAIVTLSQLPGSDNVSTAGLVSDHGDGTYSVTFTAGTSPGVDRWRLQVFDFVSFVTLQPDVEVVVDPFTPLSAGQGIVSASTGGSFPLTLDLGPRGAHRPYALLAPSHAGQRPLQAVGRLDSKGRAVFGLDFAPGQLTALTGDELSWQAHVRLGPNRSLSAAVTVGVER